MLGLSANLNYYLFNGNVDLRKGIFRLCESIREEMCNHSIFRLDAHYSQTYLCAITQ